MVFLRLTVKVLPRERLLEGSQYPNSTTGDHDSNGVVTNEATPGKPITFLVPVDSPEEVTLGGLAGLIQDMWTRLRPNSGPLEIKKILDAEHPDENLDIQLTVADVFVQHGRAVTDGQDQRAVALVIQKPTRQPIFDREGSVVQDWTCAAAKSYTSFKQRMQTLRRPESKMATVDENEPPLENASNGIDHQPDVEMENSPPLVDVSPHDTPVKSVEHEETERNTERLGSPHSWSESESIDDHSSLRGGREPSEELGVSPTHTPRQWTSLEDPFVEDGPEKLTTSVHRVRPLKVPDDDNESVVEIQAADSQEKTPTLHAQPATKPQQNGDHTLQHNREEDAVLSDIADSDIEMANSMPESVSKQYTPNKRSTPIVLVEKKIDSKDLDVAAKRKRDSLGELPPAKELRLEATHTPSKSPSHNTSAIENGGTVPQALDVTPSRRRVPSFSSPQRPFDLADPSPNVPKNSMGLGITSTPNHRRSWTPNALNETSSKEATSMLPSVRLFTRTTPSKSMEAPSFDSSSKLRSALRKTPPTDPSRSRRSVSFVGNGADREQSPSPTKTKTPAVANSTQGPAVSSPAPASSAPSFVWPDSVSNDRIEKIRKEIKMAREKKSAEKKLVEEKSVSEQKSETPPLEKGAEKISKSKKKKKTHTHVSLDASDERPALQLDKSPTLPPPAPQPVSQNLSKKKFQITDTNQGVENNNKDSKIKKKSRISTSLEVTDAQSAPQLNKSTASSVQKSPAPLPQSQQRSKQKSQSPNINKGPEKGTESTPRVLVSLNASDAQPAPQLNKTSTPSVQKKSPIPQSQLKEKSQTAPAPKGAQSSTEHKKQTQTQIQDPISLDSDEEFESQQHKNPMPVHKSPAPEPKQISQSLDDNQGAGKATEPTKQKQTTNHLSPNASDKQPVPQSNKSMTPSAHKSPAPQSQLKKTSQTTPLGKRAQSSTESKPQKQSQIPGSLDSSDKRSTKSKKSATPPVSNGPAPQSQVHTHSQSQSSEVSLPPNEKVRNGLEDRPGNDIPSASPVAKKTTATRTISAMDTSEDAYVQPDVPSTESPHSVLSQNSAATRQLHSELEIAGANSPSKTESFPSSSAPVSSGEPLTTNLANKPKYSESQSESQSSSESESDSDSGGDIPAGPFAQRKSMDPSTSTSTSTSFYFGAPNWNPVNANKRHTIQSVREELRKEMEAQAARDAEKAKTSSQTNGAKKAKKPASTRKVDKELFDMTSSEDDEDEESSSSESEDDSDDD